MGMVTIHLVVGVGILILTLFLGSFSLCHNMNLANLYIIVGAISFVTSVITAIVLVTKFINQPVAHGFFSYSDILSSVLFSLGLLLNGVLPFNPTFDVPCYQYVLVYSLFVVPMITSFFSVLGMAIERFQAFAVYRDTSVMSKKFSIAWFAASWLIAACFVVILNGQLKEHNDLTEDGSRPIGASEQLSNQPFLKDRGKNFVLASQIFPGPHSESWKKEDTIEEQGHTNEITAFNVSTGSTFKPEIIIDNIIIDKGNGQNGTYGTNVNESLVNVIMEAVTSALQNESLFSETSSVLPIDTTSKETVIVDIDRIDNEVLDSLDIPGGNDSTNFLLKSSLGNSTTNSDCDQNACVVESGRNIPESESENPPPRCMVKSDTYIMYYFTLLFMLCFATPVLITTSLNVYISSAVRSTAYDNIANHQWLTLAACVMMWCPCLLERMMSKWGVITDRLPLSVFLFLLGHTHNLLRCVLHAVFAQQSYNSLRPGAKLMSRKVSWSLPGRGIRIRPAPERKVRMVDNKDDKPAAPLPPCSLKRKDTLTPRAPCVGAGTPQPGRRATIPTITVVESASL